MAPLKVTFTDCGIGMKPYMDFRDVVHATQAQMLKQFGENVFQGRVIEVHIGTLPADQAFTFTDWTAEKKAVGAALFDCLKAAFAVERPYYRLLELEALHEAGVGVGKLSDGRSSAAFFGAFERDYAGLALGLAEVREALALFSWASAGSPLGDFFGSKAEALGTGAALFEDEDW